jgi:hypothetical protein
MNRLIFSFKKFCCVFCLWMIAWEVLSMLNQFTFQLDKEALQITFFIIYGVSYIIFTIILWLYNVRKRNRDEDR